LSYEKVKKFKEENMKKWISIILVLAMVLIAITGCAPVTQESSDAPQSSEVSSQASESEKEPAWKTSEVKITVWDGVTDDPINDSTRERFAEFDEAYPNIKVEHVLWQPEPGQDRLEYITAMAGGTGPTIFFNNFPQLIGNYIDQEFCAPLNEYVDKWHEKDYIRWDVMDVATRGDTIYGLPGESGVVAFAWNKDMFERAGLDRDTPPKTWEEMVEFGKKLQNDDAGEYAYVMLGGGGIADWWFQYYVWQAGGDITKMADDGTISLHLTDGPAEVALKFYQDMKFTHKITQKDTLKDFGGLVTDFCQQKAAMCIFMPEWMSWFVSMGMDTEQLGIATFPAGPSGKTTTSFNTNFITINAMATKDQQDAAWEYIKFMRLNREEIIEDIKDMAEQNIGYPRLVPFTNINIADYADIDPAWDKAVTDALSDSRIEYHLVESIRPYLSPAIEAALEKPDADVKKILADLQEVLQREVVDPYNEKLNK